MSRINTRQPVYEFYYQGGERINQGICATYHTLLANDEVKKTHYFEGRYENIYVDSDKLPGMGELMTFWLDSAAEVLAKPASTIRCGFWFNHMRPGDVTLPHSHDDDDEWLSGVYYLQVPENSGDLIMHDGDERITVNPAEGKLVLFSANDVHEVSKNNSSETRLSVGINFGSAQSESRPI